MIEGRILQGISEQEERNLVRQAVRSIRDLGPECRQGRAVQPSYTPHTHLPMCILLSFQKQGKPSSLSSRKTRSSQPCRGDQCSNSSSNYSPYSAAIVWPRRTNSPLQHKEGTTINLPFLSPVRSFFFLFFCFFFRIHILLPPHLPGLHNLRVPALISHFALYHSRVSSLRGRSLLYLRRTQGQHHLVTSINISLGKTLRNDDSVQHYRNQTRKARQGKARPATTTLQPIVLDSKITQQYQRVPPAYTHIQNYWSSPPRVERKQDNQAS